MVVDWLQRHPRIVDWALVVVALATTVGAASRHDYPALGVTLAVVASLPLLVRRSQPLVVLAITTAATLAISVGWGYESPFPAAVALFTVADECERRVALGAGAAAVFVLSVPWNHPAQGWRDVVGRVIGFSLAWVIGDSLGVRRRYVEALEERAARLEREREAEAARAAAEEQSRIARELHDVLVEQVRSSGLDVAITIEGEPRELPAGIDLSAYRVVQEALTNTLKHARASQAEVSLRF